MKPDWDSLGAKFKDSPKVLIADVDCTAAGKQLCETKGVRGYPTIKYYNPPDEEGEDYKGGRELADMIKFVETELGPGCSVDAQENCSAEQLESLKTFIAMPADERATKLETMKTALADARSLTTSSSSSCRPASRSRRMALRNSRRSRRRPSSCSRPPRPPAPSPQLAPRTRCKVASESRAPHRPRATSGHRRSVAALRPFRTILHAAL